MGKALTDKQFKEKLKKSNPKIKVIGKYINRTVKIEWECNKCGKIQLSLPGNLFNYSGLCPECIRKEVSKKNTKTHEQFIAELKEKNPDIKVTGKYVDAQTKIEWECNKCGKKQLSRPNSLFNCKGLCLECVKDSRFYTDKEFKEKIHKINPNIIITGTYINSDTKIEWKCRSCGKKYYSNPKALPKYSGICNKCRANSKKEYFYDNFKLLPYPPILLTPFTKVTEKIKCKCSVCGYIWESMPMTILSYKNPCPKCAKAARITDKEEFKNKLHIINPNIEALEDYQKVNVPISFKCKLCGHIWETTPNNLLGGGGCPECNHISTSFVEKILFLSLKEALGENEVLSRDKSAIGKELDIYIPNKNYAIEYGAWFWHKDRIKNDQKKVEICEARNIKLLCIYDSCPEQVHFKNTIIFKKDLSQNLDIVRKILLGIFKEINIKYSFSKEKWNNIKENAYIQSRRMTTDEFKKELKKVNEKIEVVGEYKGSHIPIKVHCLKCHNQWNAIPKELLKGTGCLKCYRKKQFDSHDTFLIKLSKINPDIEVLGTYISRRNRIEVKCKKCGHIWNPFGNTLLQGKGCPICCRKKRLDSHDTFLIKLSKINPDIEVLGTYTGQSSRIEVKCKKCGHIWNPFAGNLLQGQGCPKCFRKKQFNSHDTFLIKLSKINPDIEVLGTYTGRRNRIEVKCKKCGHIWNPFACDLLRGRGCPICAKKRFNKV